MVSGTWTVFGDGLVPVHKLTVGDASYAICIGLLALAVNIAVSVIATIALAATSPKAQKT